MSFSSFLSLALVTLLVAGPVPAQSSQDALTISVVNTDGPVAEPGSREKKGFRLQISDAAGAPVADAAIVLRFPDSGPTAVFPDGSHAAVAYSDVTGRAEVSGMQWSGETGTVPIRVTATKGAAHAGTLLEQQLSTASTVPAQDVPKEKRELLPEPAGTPPAVAHVAVSGHLDDSTAPQPGTPATPAPTTSSSPATTPVTVTKPASAAAVPSISVINRPGSEKLDSGGSHKKWIILLIAVAAGAGAGIALAGKKGSSSSATPASTPGTTIGTPTVSVGAP